MSRATARVFSWDRPSPIEGIKEKVSIDIEIKPARPEPPELPLATKPSPARLVLVRHGQSTWNREHRIQGQLDPPLSDEGQSQAEVLGRRLAGRRWAGFYASDLKRAFETATIIGRSIGVAPEAMQSLREVYLGEWEGLRTEELAARFPDAWAAWSDEPDWDLVPGGESADRFEARVSSAIEEVLARHPHGDVLLVTHGGVIQVALHRVLGRGSRGVFPFKIQNASLSLIEKRDGKLVIAGVNDIAHLEPAPG